jgi:plasmid stabilization system protein ParE
VNPHILTEAEEEIEEARKYLNRQSHGLGRHFLDDLAGTLAAIAADPLRFPKLETLPDDSPFRRALLHVFRYAVVFEIIDDLVVVVAVAHCSREPNYWLRRTT